MKEVNIGEAIEAKLREKRISKAQFGKLIGSPPQNVNRILRNEHINTEKLVLISNVLGYNFFQLYCDNPTNSASSGEKEVLNSDQERVSYLQQLLAEKERLIQYLMKDSDNRPVG